MDLIQSGHGPVWFVAVLAGVRPLLNWTRFAVENWPVSLLRTTDTAELEQLTTLIYASEERVGLRYDDPGASPLSVRDAVIRFDSFPQEKMPIVGGTSNDIGRSKRYRLRFPFTPCRFLILDGNHRTVALARSRQPFQLDLIAIRGPLDRGALPDLQHFEPKC
jgi:hypothetical protein